jgi:hypothetical protein
MDITLIMDLMKEFGLGSNYIILSNGTCVVSSATHLGSMIDDTNYHFKEFKPGTIDPHSRKLNNQIRLVYYNEDNVYNFVDYSNVKNKSGTYLSFLGRNQLLKDLRQPTIQAVVINHNLVNEFTNYKIPRYRED